MQLIKAEEKFELCKKLANNFSTLRAKADLSQGKLAGRPGFARQTINALENGR